MTSLAALTIMTLLAAPQRRDEAALRSLLHGATQDKATHVRIPPGVYRLKADAKTRTHLLFDGVEDLTIDATGVEFVMTQPQYSLIAFRNCRRVTLRGLTIDCDPILFTQGAVAAIEPNGAWYDVRIEDGYRTDIENLGRPRPMSIFDPKTREFKTGVPDLFMSRIEKRGGRVWRAFPIPEVIGRHRFPTDTVHVGDLAAIAFSGGPAITCRGCEDMTFERVTIYQSGSMAFHEHGGGGGTKLLRCRVLRKPGTTRLLSTCADGFHCKDMRRGPVVEACTFEGMHDDGINIHGMFSRVLEAATGTTVVTSPAFTESAVPGDKVEFFRTPSCESVGTFTVKKKTRLPLDDWREKAKLYWPTWGHKFAYRLTLDRTPDVKPGDAMVSTSYVGSGYVIRNCEFRNLRYRAILAKGSNGLIVGNRIYGCANDAIALTPILYDECSFSRNVIVRGNTIRHTGMLPWHRAAIHVSVVGRAKGVTCREHRDITIEGNLIDDVAGTGIRVTNASRVKIVGNRILRVGERRVSKRVPVAIEVGNSEHVEIEGNRIENTSAESRGIAVGPGCDVGTISLNGKPVQP